MGIFSGVPNSFLVKNWNIFFCPYSPKKDKYVLLPPKISQLLPQYGIVSRQQGALGLAYASMGEVRRTWLLFCYKERVTVFSWEYNLILILLVFRIEL